MRAILFDLGNTLVDEDTQPLPGAFDLLRGVGDLCDADGQPVLSALVSDWIMPDKLVEIEPLREEYLDELHKTGLDVFFEPLDKRVTLSTEVGVFKPDQLIFRTALDRLELGLAFTQAVFVTESLDHVEAARQLGLMAIHFKGPGQVSGEVEELASLLPLFKQMLGLSASEA